MDEQAALSCCVTYLLLPLKLLNFSEMRISENCESFQWRESFCDAAGFARPTNRFHRRGVGPTGSQLSMRAHIIRSADHARANPRRAEAAPGRDRKSDV